MSKTMCADVKLGQACRKGAGSMQSGQPAWQADLVGALET